MAAEIHCAPRLERLSAEDFETASVRSAAPSYVSGAPSYHSTLPPNEPTPAYTPRVVPSSAPQLPVIPSAPSVPSAPTTSPFTRGAGLPPLPTPSRRSQLPQLPEFRIGAWSSSNNNSNSPRARHYQAVAHRRASAAMASPASTQVDKAVRAALARVDTPDEPGADRTRPLEDPYLVGEEAANRARTQRLARENGDDILIREDRRWDWFLAQMKTWDERDQSWKNFRRELESNRRGKLARRVGR